jgi:translocation and assembly module TamA
VLGTPAVAFDPLAWLGLRPAEEAPAPVRPGTAPYRLTVEVAGPDGSRLLDAVEDASSLYRLRNQPALDPEGLVRLAEADIARVMNGLWALGYYNCLVTIDLAGVTLVIGAQPSAAAVGHARRQAADGPVPIRIIVDPGQQFTIRTVDVRDAVTGAPFAQGDVPPATVGLPPGTPASSAEVLASESRIVDRLRGLSHPFAKPVALDPVVFHPERVMDVAMSFSPGPVAALGDISIEGLQTVDPAVVRSFIYAEPGDPYSPEAIAAIRKSVGRIEALGSVRVREAGSLDASGRLPLFVEVTERKPNAVGFSAGYSTVDGPQLQTYWTNRNLFGGAEVLRLEASLTYLNAFEDKRSSFSWDDLGGRLRVSFLKPALGGTRNDLLAEASAARVDTKAYEASFVNAAAGIRHRFSDSVSFQAGVEAEYGDSRDLLSRLDYSMVGLPVSLTYDSTDRPLDPTRGLKLQAGFTPYLEHTGAPEFNALWNPDLFPWSTTGDLSPGSRFMGVTRVSGSTYWSLDDEGRTVLAARLGFGSIVGPDLFEIPGNHRFYAGGANSVRGYEFESLSPQAFGRPIGGRSMIDGSIEARIKLTDTIGIVPFVDAGMAFEPSLPDFGEQRLAVGVGIGLRYYTAIGPIRLDIATPLDRQYGDRPVVLYVGIGQAF